MGMTFHWTTLTGCVNNYLVDYKTKQIKLSKYLINNSQATI
jgi:hypothetical protein